MVRVDAPMMEKKEPIHQFFGLTYANYLVLPRSILQSMPEEWQNDFVGLLEQIPEYFGTDWEPEGGYRVHAVDKNGKYQSDLYSNYDRGRRMIVPIGNR